MVLDDAPESGSGPRVEGSNPLPD